MSPSNRNGVGAEIEGEKINTNIVTLTRFLTEEQVKHKEATGDFTYVNPPSHLLFFRIGTTQQANMRIPASSAMPSSSPSSPSPTTSAAPHS